MKMPQFTVTRFGVANIGQKKIVFRERPLSAYELEFYTEDSVGGAVTDGVFRPARKQHYSLFRPGQRQKLVPPYRCYYLNILTQDPELCDYLDCLPDSGLLWDMEAVVKLLQEMMQTPDKQSILGRLWLDSCATKILAMVGQHRRLEEPMLRGAIRHRETLMYIDRYIREHLNEDLSLGRLGALSNLEPTYLQKLYVGAYGKTPAQRVLTCRINAAKIALLEGELSIGEIAARCGFSSQAYLTNKFKQIVGKTPTQYRQKLMERYREERILEK